jgi:hypothetical protein
MQSNYTVPLFKKEGLGEILLNNIGNITIHREVIEVNRLL